METRVAVIRSKIFEELLNNEDIKQAANLLRSGKLIGFPTETVYGLGASIFSEEAVSKVYRVKGRPNDNPFIVHISNMSMLEEIVEDVPPSARKLCNEFWPGPLTILFIKKPTVSDVVTAGLQTVAIRMPSHPVALAMIELAKVPVAAPSANISGFPSPTLAIHVYNDLKGKIPLILDGGASDIGVESTVIDLHQDPPIILRPGGMTFEKLREFLPSLKIFGKDIKSKEMIEKPSSPGMKYRHYSPKAEVILIEDERENINSLLINEYKIQIEKHKKIGIIHTHSNIPIENIIDKSKTNEIINLFKEDSRFSLSEIVARGIFAALRELDQRKVDVILVEGISERERGLAVMNRLRKAASKIVKN